MYRGSELQAFLVIFFPPFLFSQFSALLQKKSPPLLCARLLEFVPYLRKEASCPLYAKQYHAPTIEIADCGQQNLFRSEVQVKPPLFYFHEHTIPQFPLRRFLWRIFYR